eukprot:TRINITY_DN54699_c0_g1_i1.p1 TRINITY_DN54699_c0_g1~~TRINITY_DN54699_c0_g1_i1.p1  ORF type:complete len:225 (+),score=30.32 TRINITY_DN54699_c0_g1_i1:182-856(+)
MSTGQLNLNASSTFRSSQKYSFPGKPAPKDKTATPGPGKYVAAPADLDKYFKTPKWSMGAGVRDDGKEPHSTPGPGAYKPAKDPRYTNQPAFSMGSGSRSSAIKPQTAPGPGKYEVRGNMDGLMMSISARPEGNAGRSTTPGPGAYKPMHDQCFASAPRLSFGSGSRSKLQPSKTPGPGQYEAMSTLGGNAVMKTPGKYSMKYRHAPPATDITPGPPAAGTTFK